MATQSSTWTLGMDVTGAVQAMGQLGGSIGQQKAALEEMLVVMSKYNEKQKVFEHVVKGKGLDGNDVTLKVRENKAGIFGLKEDIFEFNDPVEQLKKKQKEFERAQLASDKITMRLQRERLAEEVKNEKAAAKQIADNKRKELESGRANRKSAAISKIKPEEEDDESGILSRLPRLASVQLLKQAINSLIHEVVSGTQEAIKFQVQISELRTISQGANVSFGQWAETIQMISDKFGHAQTDVAEASYQALSNQVVQTRGELDSFVTTASRFGQVTQATATQSVELLSSALKSYGKDVTEAEDVSAKLFKTIEVGRIRAPEMANTFGRIGAIAHTLGVSLEETGAALATLTLQGVKYSDASTFLTNVLTKLTRPTTEMKELFKQWGVASGEAAIATYGFQGVLTKLGQASKGSLTELSELFNEIRGLKGAAGLTLFEGFDKNLEAIKNSTGDYVEAQKIIVESPGKQIQIEMNKIKNYFIDGLGTTTLGIVNEVTQTLGGLSEIVKFVSSVVLNNDAAWGAYKIAVLVATAATQAYSAAVGYSSVAMTASIPVIGAVAAAVGLLYLSLRNSADEALRTSTNIQALAEESKKKASFIDQGDLANFRDSTTSLFGGVDKVLANSFIESEKRLKSMREATKEIGSELSVGFSTAVDKINEGIRQMKKGITDAQSEIKKSSKSVVDYQRGLEDELRNQQNKFATPEQKIGFNNQYIDQLKDEIRKQFASGDKDEIDSARKKFDELKRLYSENFDTQVEIAKRSGGIVAVNVSGLKSTFQDLATARANYEKSYQAQLNRTINRLEDLTTREQQRVKLIEKSVRSFNELQDAITGGKLDKNDPKYKDFYDKDGKLQTEKLAAELKRRAAIVITQGNAAAIELLKIGQGIDAQLLASGKAAQEEINSLKKNSVIQIGNLEKTAYLELLNFKIQETQKANATAKAESLKVASELEKAQRELSEGLRGSGEGLGKGKDDLKDIINLLASARDSFSGINGLNFRINLPQRKEMTAAINEAMKDVEALQKAFAEMSATNVKSPEALKELEKKLETSKQRVLSLIVALNKLEQAKQQNPNASIYNTIVGSGDKQVAIGLITTKLQGELKAVDELSKKVREQLSNFDQVKNGPAEVIAAASGELRESLLLSLTTGANAENDIRGNFKGIGQSVDEVIGKVKNFNDAINGLSLRGILLRVEQTEAGPVAKADGGYLYGPRGADNIPAWLTKGEFVMNQAATAMYRPILESMNQSKRPGYYNSGGYVTTNIGDININMTSTGKAETDVRRIGNLLRREIKRGNVTLR